MPGIHPCLLVVVSGLPLTLFSFAWYQGSLSLLLLLLKTHQLVKMILKINLKKSFSCIFSFLAYLLLVSFHFCRNAVDLQCCVTYVCVCVCVCVCTHTLFGFFSHISHYRVLSRVPCAIWVPRCCSGKESTCQWRRCRRHRFHPWVGRIPWRKKWHLTPVFLPGKSRGQRSLVGYSPWGHKVLDELNTHRPHIVLYIRSLFVVYFMSRTVSMSVPIS